MAQNMQLIKSKFVLFSLAHDAFRKYFSRHSKNALLHFETSWKKLLILMKIYHVEQVLKLQLSEPYIFL